MQVVKPPQVVLDGQRVDAGVTGAGRRAAAISRLATQIAGSAAGAGRLGAGCSLAADCASIDLISVKGLQPAITGSVRLKAALWSVINPWRFRGDSNGSAMDFPEIPGGACLGTWATVGLCGRTTARVSSAAMQLVCEPKRLISRR